MRRCRVLCLGVVTGVWGRVPEEVIFEMILEREECVLGRGSEPWKNPELPSHYKNARRKGPEHEGPGGRSEREGHDPCVCFKGPSGCSRECM